MIHRLRKKQWLAMACIACLVSPSVSAAVPDLNANGWHTWRVTAKANASDWCCFSWNSGRSTRKSCDLDGRNISYSSSDEDDFVVDEMQIYAYTQAGKVTKIRALSARCPVNTKTEITDLGTVEADDSVDWLEQFVDPRSKLSTHVMAAISTHNGDHPTDVLMDIVRNSSNLKSRKDAIFWLVQSKSDQAYQYIERLLSEN